ncbi:dihydrofolate reductase family protein [Bacillus tianshenii]|nr:dihydrofolate reductase family protein [Bacillus tianshenii]
MTRQVVLFIATSLDGYIARPNGDISWLEAVQGEGDNGFAAFYETIDTLIMGRKTYDHLLELTNNQYPHADKESYVFSYTEQRVDSNVTFTNENVALFMEKLKQKQGKNIWLVGGAGIVEAFMADDLVDELILTTAPVILGNGIPLFRECIPEGKWSLVESKRLGEFVQSHYVRG